MRTYDDYVNIIKANELDILAGESMMKLARKYGLCYKYLHQIYKRLSLAGEIKSKYKRVKKSPKVLQIEELILERPEKRSKYINIARELKCSREYVRQIKNYLIAEGKLKPKKESLFDA